MKKLMRKNLEELAKVMPVICEDEARGIIGGTVYFDVSGNRVGKVGTSDEMRVVSKEEWESYNEHLGMATDKDYTKMGISLSSASDRVKTVVASSYARGLGFLGAQVNSKVDLNADAGIQPGNPDVVLIQHNSMILNHENDLINTIQHEKYHYITGNVESTPHNEIGAIEYQISQPEYSLTTKEYKKTVADYLYRQWQEIGIADTPGHYAYDAQFKCKAL